MTLHATGDTRLRDTLDDAIFPRFNLRKLHGRGATSRRNSRAIVSRSFSVSTEQLTLALCLVKMRHIRVRVYLVSHFAPSCSQIPLKSNEIG